MKNLISKIKKYSAGLVLGAGLTVASLAHGENIKLERHFENWPVYPSVGAAFSLAVEADRFDLDSSLVTTRVHPDDRNGGDGRAKADVENAIELPLEARLFAALGTDNIRAVGGAYAQLNNLTTRSGYRQGYYAVKLQDLPSPYESYAYTQVRQAPVTYGTFAGLQVLFGDWNVEADWLQPHFDWTVERGHDRYGKWEEEKTNHLRGTGQGYRICASGGDDGLSIGLCGGQEMFSGEKSRITETQLSFMLQAELK